MVGVTSVCEFRVLLDVIHIEAALASARRFGRSAQAGRVEDFFAVGGLQPGGAAFALPGYFIRRRGSLRAVGCERSERPGNAKDVTSGGFCVGRGFFQGLPVRGLFRVFSGLP